MPALTDKWYGESEKLSTAVFTLAHKLEPCIVFIDEIDTFLRARGEFMILWDGLRSRKSQSGVIVFGATNRPNDVDKAILRRMPALIGIPSPKKEQRLQILRHMLSEEPIDTEVDFEELAQSTDQFSASDLKELCRGSVFNRLAHKKTEIIEILSSNESSDREERVDKLVSDLGHISRRDFEITLEDMLKSRKYESYTTDRSTQTD